MTATPVRAQSVLEQPGAFAIGCNYWASHAGTSMWRDWRPEVVDADFAALAAKGLDTLRVFPLWSDFQPITQLRCWGANRREIRFGEEPLPDTAEGRAGMDARMLDRFHDFCVLAAKHRMRLVVGLLTGWMSGRLFVPPALEGLNVITDPLALVWEVRYLRAFIARLRTESAIIAWDLGNECNCMGQVATREQAAHWTATVADAIRASDPTRPVVSGMHSLVPADKPWTISDQAEHCDLLTTHPYPFWCAHTVQDGPADPRTTFHATAETRLYADLGGKPCFAEEIGTMGPMVCNDADAAAFVRVNLHSLWANDCRGMLWWCGFDQGHLAGAPYDWTAVERELGMFDAGGRPRALLGEFARFRAFLDGLPFTTLPPARREAVCILSGGQDHWAIAWASWILAKQAGFDLRFAWGEDPLPESAWYFLPSAAGCEPLSRRRWHELIARVQAGAHLYASLDGGFLSPFTEVFGATIAHRRNRRGTPNVRLPDGTVLPITAAVDLGLEAQGAEALAVDGEGVVRATRNALGKGSATLLAFPIEAQVTATVGSLDAGASAWWKWYRRLIDPRAAGRVVAKDDAPWLALTEHEVSRGQRLLVAINHAREDSAATLRLAPGWQVAQTLLGEPVASGESLRLRLPAQDATAVLLTGSSPDGRAADRA